MWLMQYAKQVSPALYTRHPLAVRQHDVTCKIHGDQRNDEIQEVRHLNATGSQRSFGCQSEAAYTRARARTQTVQTEQTRTPRILWIIVQTHIISETFFKRSR